MDVLSFRLALTRSGVTQAEALDAIVAQGFASMNDLKRLTEVEIEAFIKAVNKLPAAFPGGISPQIVYGSIKKLKAMRNWAIERDRFGVPIDHAHFTDEEIERILARMDEEANFAVNKPVTPPLPEKFSSFGPKWREFCDGLKGHCAIVRGCMNIPLAYLLRDEEPTAETLAADAAGDVDLFDTSDERLMALVRCAGSEFRQDNKRLWDLLCPLIRSTPAWEYVKTYERACDGQRAFQTLRLRGEGDAAVDARRTKAEATIAKAQFTGKSKRFTLQSYINLLQGAFNELEECGDPYSEKKKVDTFVKGMVGDRMGGVRHHIMGNAVMRQDFQMAYGYVETMENFKSTTDGGGDGFDRNISQVGQTPRRDQKDQKKGKGRAYIPPAEWAKLSDEERKKVQSDRDKKRKAKKQGKGGKEKDGSGDLKRKLSAVAAKALREIDDDNEDDGSSSGKKSGKPKKKTSEKSGEAHDQFGRNVHAMVKFASKVAAELDDASE